MSSDNLSAQDMARLQAEGLEPAPADWLDRQRWRARSEGELDALDDPVKAASRYQRAKEQKAEQERRHRYVRGLPPLEEHLTVGGCAQSTTQADNQAAIPDPISAYSVDRPTQPQTEKIRVRHRTRSSVLSSTDTATCRPDLKVVEAPHAPKAKGDSEEASASTAPAAGPAMAEVDPPGPIARNIRVRTRTRPSFTSLLDPASRQLHHQIVDPADKSKATAGTADAADGVGPRTDEEHNRHDGRSEWRPDEYPVGKGRPPLHTRFKPGQSGNPKGRPKGAKNAQTLAQEVLTRKLPAKIHGKTVKVSGTEAIFEKVFAKVMEKGDLKSAEFLFRQAGLLAPAAGKGEGTGPSAAPPEPLSEAQEDILTFHRRDLLGAAGVDPATIEAILKGVTEEPDPPSNQADTPKAAGGSR